MGTVSSLAEAIDACRQVQWLGDKVCVTPGINGKEYSVLKAEYTDHR